MVIIGLIVGGVLVGQDLVTAAKVRSQISQIEQYNTAVNTFRLKYGYLPGDIPDPVATGFGFVARGVKRGQGDGNWVIEGNCEATLGGMHCTNSAYSFSGFQKSGETAMFWEDLSTAGMISGNFNTAPCCGTSYGTDVYETTTPAIKDYFPSGKLDTISVQATNGGVSGFDGLNYFTISHVYAIAHNENDGDSKIPVIQAYNIDKKIDDGLPQTGKVLALVLLTFSNEHLSWANGNWGSNPMVTPSETTCFDTTSWQYSVGQNGGNGKNCALSFKFQ